MLTIDQNNIKIYFKNSPIFSNLDEHDRKLLEEKSIINIYKAGDTIIEQSDDSKNVFFLI